MTKPILFIVPSLTLKLHSRVIRLTLWAVESDRSYVVMSADAFVDMIDAFGPVEDAAAKLRAGYEGVCNLGTLSKREHTAYRQVMDPIQEYIATPVDAAAAPQEA